MTFKKGWLEIDKFEVGKFYLIQVCSWDRKKYPAKCVRITKISVTFEYLFKTGNNVRISYVRMKRGKRWDDGVESVTGYGLWNTIAFTYADEVCDKPQRWDEVEAEVAKNSK